MTIEINQIRWEELFPSQHLGADATSIRRLHEGQSVLITGAGGSIGSALAERVRRLKPSQLVLLDSSEPNLYRLHTSLSSPVSDLRYVPLLGSVADERCVNNLFERFKPKLIYHAAAFKHVPLGEMNPFAVIQNNVFGTWVIATAALRFGSERLMMISTDKAVNPRSILGATKRVAEIVTSALSNHSTSMSSIRLCNVLASEGSVVPLFLDQIARGAPVTVTHPDVERYFLTMDETVGRILRAVTLCPPNGKLAVPAMVNPIRIADLANFLIRELKAKDIQITYSGLRPGDKLHEEFTFEHESNVGPQSAGLQWVAGPHCTEAELAPKLAGLQLAVNDMNLSRVLAALTHIVPEYQPSSYLLDQTTVGMVR